MVRIQESVETLIGCVGSTSVSFPARKGIHIVNDRLMKPTASLFFFFFEPFRQPQHSEVYYVGYGPGDPQAATLGHRELCLPVSRSISEHTA